MELLALLEEIPLSMLTPSKLLILAGLTLIVPIVVILTIELALATLFLMIISAAIVGAVALVLAAMYLAFPIKRANTRPGSS